MSDSIITIKEVKKALTRTKRLIKTYQVTAINFNMYEELQSLITLFEEVLITKHLQEMIDPQGDPRVSQFNELLRLTDMIANCKSYFIHVRKYGEF